MPPAVEDKTAQQLEDFSAFAWALKHNIVTENQKPLDWTSHAMMIMPLCDLHPDIVTMKSAQVGWTTIAILQSIHAGDKFKLNTIYTLPTKNVIKEFVVPKVNPIFNSNEVLGELLTNDSQNLKQIGDRFIYFRGAFTERDAISVSGDILVHDELDRSDQKIINMYRSRLQASEVKWRRRFSNPSIPGYGVNLLWQDSDQQHWFVTCSHCEHESFMNDVPDETSKLPPHYLDLKRKIFACGECDQEIYDEDRANGRWVAKYPKKADYPNKGDGRRGYWISQLMAPWVTAKELTEIYFDVDTTPEYWYNFVLGLPYQNADLKVNRETILRATTPNIISLDEVAIGVDNGVLKHFVMMTPQGVFRYGVTESWDEIEGFLIQYPNAKMVIDANPYPDIPTKLTKKYRGRVWINYYQQDKTNLATVRWDEGDNFGVVKSDRTKIFDQVAGEIVRRDMVFVMRPQAMESYISHWTPMFRTIEVNAKQQKKGVWLTQENRPDHWAHATIYSRLALMKASSGFMGGLMPSGTGAARVPSDVGMTTPGVINVQGEQAIPAMVDPKEEAEITDLSSGLM